MGQNRKKHRLNSHLIIHCPTTKGVSEVSERCGRTSERTSEWPSIKSRFLFVPDHSAPVLMVLVVQLTFTLSYLVSSSWGQSCASVCENHYSHRANYDITEECDLGGKFKTSEAFVRLLVWLSVAIGEKKWHIAVVTAPEHQKYR